ncbi:trimethylamine methyltransferase [Hypericibacter adhaerens]|jgi:trimethylamine--corrinoid protein Co-methyltransferase|uniref:Methyltransferase n=1 Tax=Hypericibacter adhaerens TaxID=2602016 RepID=A0A5J6MSB6_9PROT|nr:trimethylamine methyltransferase family protein [Hypericibacter adhaerens]QEX20161.1 trimethylamine methyltransferase [Hypericibacter adhaerens]
MTTAETRADRRSRRRTGGGNAASPSARSERYRHLVNPFEPIRLFSEDQVEAMHQAALRILEEIGLRVLLPEACQRFRAAGAAVDEESRMVRIDRGLVQAALRTAPSAYDLVAPAAHRTVRIAQRHLAVIPVGGPPHVTDSDRGKRSGTLEDFRDFTKLSQQFDVVHCLGACIEPQDIAPEFRHLETMRAQLTLGDKPPFIYSRGNPQVRDCFAMVRLNAGLSEEQFESAAHCYTVINTNSPLQLDIPMSQGIIDFAAAGQLSIITPFTLAGAMAPITLPGALTQAHAEALAGITLAQIVRAGAPVAYGGFTSNVDMKSGAPAFGTPEYVKAAFGAGQLARHINLPWRSSNATASNVADAQAAYESEMSLWGAIMGGCSLLIHGAGWLEGGLAASYEKFILDIEMLQMFAELFQPVAFDADEIGVEAIAEVGPGGHFFGTGHTLGRYEKAFYAPLVSDWRNFGSWSEDGARTATERANALWKKTLQAFQPPPKDPAVTEALDGFIARRRQEGGAPPVS